MNIKDIANNNGICIHKEIIEKGYTTITIDNENCNYYGEGNPRKCNANQCPALKGEQKNEKD